MSKATVYKKIVEQLESVIRQTRVHLEVVKRMQWNPRADGKPRADLNDNFTVDGVYPTTHDPLFRVSTTTHDPLFRVSMSDNAISFRIEHICLDSGIELGYGKDIPSAHYYIPTRIDNPTPKQMFDEVKAKFKIVAKRRLAHLNRELTSVKEGKFKKMFDAMADSIIAFHKEYTNFDKHKYLAGMAYEIHDSSFIY